MLSFHRFLYGIIVGSLIVWTIYLLTVDFYSIAFVHYQHKHIMHIPFTGDELSLYTLGMINLFTLIVISCSMLILQLKNIKMTSVSIYDVKRSEEEINA